ELAAVLLYGVGLHRLRGPAGRQQPAREAWQTYASQVGCPVEHLAGAHVEAGAVNGADDPARLEPAAAEVAASVRAPGVHRTVAATDPRHHDCGIADLERLEPTVRNVGRLTEQDALRHRPDYVDMAGA